MRNRIWLIVFVVFVVGITSYGCKRSVEEINLGAILPLTGGAAKYGESAKRAIDLAVAEINSKGGIGRRKVRIIYEDSQALPQQGVAAITKLGTVNKVPVVIGAMASSVTLAIAPVAEKNKIVLISPVSSAPKISEAGDYVFRNCMSDVYEGAKMAAYAFKELGLRKIAILYVNNDYGSGLRGMVESRFKSLGGRVVTMQSFDQGSSDFRTQLAKIKQAKPEAIYMVGYKEQILILKQAKEMGITQQFLGSVMFEDPEILEKVGKAADGVIYTYYPFDPAGEQELVSQFTNQFNKKYGTQPDIYAALSYDAMRIVASAIRRGGMSPGRIKQALYDTKDFPGVAGSTTFDENGDAIKPVSIKTVRDGEFVWLKMDY
ncbi:MAG: hypothetical protein E3J82_01170 [Candidatus Thorarchaeota archaeon]|nr:MAG: hypothetical protein E3J82_01170 [Candidatus Thorarchaeota archaeon]